MEISIYSELRYLNKGPPPSRMSSLSQSIVIESLRVSDILESSFEGSFEGSLEENSIQGITNKISESLFQDIVPETNKKNGEPKEIVAYQLEEVR